MNPEHNPWTLLSKQLVYDNPWIRVQEHQVLNPAGKPGIYGVVHFKNQAIGVVPWDNGHIWLVGQYRFPLSRFSWEIPEGGGPHGEDPLAAAVRELEEETGLTAGNWELIVQMDLSNSVSDEVGYIFLATDLRPGTAAPEETEELYVQRVPFEEALARVESGEIRDSLTVAALYKIAWMRATGKL